ncbi:hypothetical protein RvY_17963 [Ramazzottius varieornatus]|uniref:Uncharacterized protein n=1 Tax=Ramazzottius varieornatus TaxID=947166 RepID=A0A1D1WAF0_RAMVA|nr:hypothetical protein RvY_17963 [Ramazzottius varieornatus]
MIPSSSVPRGNLQRSITHDFSTCDALLHSLCNNAQSSNAPASTFASWFCHGYPVLLADIPHLPVLRRSGNPLQMAQQRKNSLPSEELSLFIEVCVECHNVLYHAIMESQTERFYLYTSCVRQLTGDWILNQVDIFLFLAPPWQSYSRFTEYRGLVQYHIHTSASSFVSDSQSDSLDETSTQQAQRTSSRISRLTHADQNFVLHICTAQLFSCTLHPRPMYYCFRDFAQ